MTGKAKLQALPGLVGNTEVFSSLEGQENMEMHRETKQPKFGQYKI